MNFQDKPVEKSASIQAPIDDEHVIVLKYGLKPQCDHIEKTDVHVTFAPILITLQKEIFCRLSDSYSDVLQSNSNASTADNSNSFSGTDSITKARNTELKFECKHISIVVPLPSIKISQQADINMSKKLDNLFQRSGYITEPVNMHSCPTIILATNDVNINLRKKCIHYEQKELEISTTLQTSVVSIVSPTSSFDMKYWKFDLLSIESETQIDPDAIIKIEYSKVSLENRNDAFKKKRAKKFFPLIVPIASVKSSQQFDHETTDGNFYESSLNSKAFGDSFAQSLNGMKRMVRGVDPQIGMLREAGLCESNIVVSIPSIAMDLTTCEKESIHDLLSQLPSNEEKEELDKTDADPVVASSNRIGLSFSCNQFSLSLHHNSEKTKSKPKNTIYTQLIAFDGIRVHCLLDGNKLKHFRFICDDVTLHDGEFKLLVRNILCSVLCTNVSFQPSCIYFECN